MPFDIELLRPGFEAYVRSERPPSYLERVDPYVDAKRDYQNLFVQEAWEAWRAAKNEPGPAPSPSHVHCVGCNRTSCEGIRHRDALPATGPSPEAIRRARAEGRAEAFNLLIAQDAETFCEEDKYLSPYALGDTGDYGVQWNDAAVRELLRVDDVAFSEIDQLEASYWTQQGFITGLQIQLSEEWLPIGAAEDLKDGRYILGWFPDRPKLQRVNETDPPEPWVAAVRWTGSDLTGWSMLGIGGLLPTKFKAIVGPDGKPVGYLRTAV